MLALIQRRLSPAAFRDALLTGTRYGGAEAEEREIVDEVAPPEELTARAIERASAAAGKARNSLHTLKLAMYRESFDLLNAG
jgi:enoyl-CoA hydratase/carnithine racemase